MGRSPRACAATPRSSRGAYPAAAFGVQRLGPAIVPVGLLDIAHGEVRRCPAGRARASRTGSPVPDSRSTAAGRLAAPRHCDPGPKRRRPCGSGSGPTGTPWLPQDRVQDRQATLGRPARTRAMPRLARTSVSRLRSPALRANRRACLSSSIAFRFTECLRTTPAAWWATAASAAEGSWPAPHARRRGLPTAATAPGRAACPAPRSPERWQSRTTFTNRILCFSIS